MCTKYDPAAAAERTFFLFLHSYLLVEARSRVIVVCICVWCGDVYKTKKKWSKKTSYSYEVIIRFDRVYMLLSFGSYSSPDSSYCCCYNVVARTNPKSSTSRALFFAVYRVKSSSSRVYDAKELKRVKNNYRIERERDMGRLGKEQTAWVEAINGFTLLAKEEYWIKDEKWASCAESGIITHSWIYVCIICVRMMMTRMKRLYVGWWAAAKEAVNFFFFLTLDEYKNRRWRTREMSSRRRAAPMMSERRNFYNIFLFCVFRLKEQQLMTFWSDQKKISADIEIYDDYIWLLFFSSLESVQPVFSSQLCVVGVVCELWSAPLTTTRRVKLEKNKAYREFCVCM